MNVYPERESKWKRFKKKPLNKMNRLIHIIVNNGINLLQIIILVRVIMSWIPHNPHNQWTRLLYQVTEPILQPIRNILPGQSMGFDFSPVVVFLLLGLLKSALESVLWSYKAGVPSSSFVVPNDDDDPVGAGVYLYQLQTKDFVKIRKMVLIRWTASVSMGVFTPAFRFGCLCQIT